VAIQRLDARFYEGSFAEQAAVTGNSLFADVTKPFGLAVLTLDAGHGLISACVLRKKPYNRLEVQSWASSAIGLAPTSVSAEAGALSVTGYWLWWFDTQVEGKQAANNFESDAPHCEYPFLKRPRSQRWGFRTSLQIHLRRRLHLVRAGFSFPTVAPTKLDIASGFQLATLFHSFHSRVNRCHVVVELAQVEANRPQRVPNTLRGKNHCRVLGSAGAYHASDCVGQRNASLGGSFPTERSKPCDCLQQLLFALREMLHIGFNLSQFQPCFSQCGFE
jgi:hypothetical protein